MIVDEGGRAVMFCDRCRIRLEIGPYQRYLARGERMPSMWMKSGRNEHLCPQCATAEMQRMGLRV